MTGSTEHRPPDGEGVAPVEVLLLDFGGVCLLSPVELHQRAEEALDLGPGTIDWFGPLDPSTDELWRRMVTGDGLNEREYWQHQATELGRRAGRELDLREYMRILYDPPRDELVRPEAVAVSRAALAAGIGVSVLTNDLRAFHGPDWAAGIGYLDLVDHLVDCSDTNILKPDPRAFQRAVDIIGVEPSRVLFVDDQPLNVVGGDDFGFQTMWFDIADATRSWHDVGHRLGLTIEA